MKKLPSTLKCIVIDWDGTLVTAEPMVHEAYVETFRSLGDNRVWTPADTHARNGQNPDTIFADKTLWGDRGCDAKHFFYAHYNRLKTQHPELLTVKNGATEFVDMINEIHPNLKIIILAAKTQDLLEEEVCEKGFSARVDAVIGKTLYGPNKPDKAVFDRAMKETHVDITDPATQVLHIGDNPVIDEKFARDYGAISIIVNEKSMFQNFQDLSQLFSCVRSAQPMPRWKTDELTRTV